MSAAFSLYFRSASFGSDSFHYETSEEAFLPFLLSTFISKSFASTGDTAPGLVSSWSPWMVMPADNPNAFETSTQGSEYEKTTFCLDWSRESRKFRSASKPSARDAMKWYEPNKIKEKNKIILINYSLMLWIDRWRSELPADALNCSLTL